MQLASSGARAATRTLKPPGHRSIHIPAHARTQVSSSGTVHRVVSRARTYLGQFVAHLTAPGLKAPTTTPAYARSLHGAGPSRFPSIQQRLSLPVRTSLSRPLQGHYFPKAPAVGRPCSVTNVGLGTARNFSSGRSVFQNLVENVPIAGRAFYEADWDVKLAKERSARRKAMHTQRKAAHGKEMLKPKNTKKARRAVPEATPSEEMEHYFAAPVADVTTCLLIPLAPTPTSRVPLPEYAPDTQSLLPRSELWGMHANHEQHSLKVSSLFSRLDVANVWERGVQCSAYAHSAGMDGVCTILKVEFRGWTKSEVRSVIGESGTGWCVLEETKVEPEEEDDAFSDTSSLLSGISGGISDTMEVSALPPSIEDSFILPTLDFSYTFQQSAALPPEHSDSGFDKLTDWDSDSWSDLSDPPESRPLSPRFGFSSSFLDRAEVDHEYTPREVMF